LDWLGFYLLLPSPFARLFEAGITTVPVLCTCVLSIGGPFLCYCRGLHRGRILPPNLVIKCFSLSLNLFPPIPQNTVRRPVLPPLYFFGKVFSPSVSALDRLLSVPSPFCPCLRVVFRRTKNLLVLSPLSPSRITFPFSTPTPSFLLPACIFQQNHTTLLFFVFFRLLF